MKNDEKTGHHDIAFIFDDEWECSPLLFNHLNTLVLKMQLLFNYICFAVNYL